MSEPIDSPVTMRPIEGVAPGTREMGPPKRGDGRYLIARERSESVRESDPPTHHRDGVAPGGTRENGAPQTGEWGMELRMRAHASIELWPIS